MSITCGVFALFMTGSPHHPPPTIPTNQPTRWSMRPLLWGPTWHTHPNPPKNPFPIHVGKGDRPTSLPQPQVSRIWATSKATFERFGHGLEMGGSVLISLKKLMKTTWNLMIHDYSIWFGTSCCYCWWLKSGQPPEMYQTTENICKWYKLPTSTLAWFLPLTVAHLNTKRNQVSTCNPEPHSRLFWEVPFPVSISSLTA